MKKTYPRDEPYFPIYVSSGLRDINYWLECMGITTLRAKVLYIWAILKSNA